MLIYVSAPSKVLELNAIESAPNEVTLSWKMPAIHNGEIMNYIVNYIGRKEVIIARQKVLFPFRKDCSCWVIMV